MVPVIITHCSHWPRTLTRNCVYLTNEIRNHDEDRSDWYLKEFVGHINNEEVHCMAFSRQIQPSTVVWRANQAGGFINKY